MMIKPRLLSDHYLVCLPKRPFFIIPVMTFLNFSPIHFCPTVASRLLFASAHFLLRGHRCCRVALLFTFLMSALSVFAPPKPARRNLPHPWLTDTIWNPSSYLSHSLRKRDKSGDPFDLGGYQSLLSAFSSSICAATTALFVDKIGGGRLEKNKIHLQKYLSILRHLYCVPHSYAVNSTVVIFYHWLTGLVMRRITFLISMVMVHDWNPTRNRGLCEI